MPLPVVTVAAIAQCPHGIPVQFTSSAMKVQFAGTPPMVGMDRGAIAGCPFTIPPGKPQPCAFALLLQPATKVLVEGQPVLLQSPSDICQSADQIPNGPVVYSNVQFQVTAT